MAELLTFASLFTLLMLIMLQAVLGFDNLLYISIESRRVAESEQSRVRRLGIGIAIALRIVLLFVLVSAIGYFQTPFFNIDFLGIEGEVTGHALIVIVGGVFIIYTAVKEIMHMMAIDDIGHGVEDDGKKTFGQALGMIVAMNLVFSFDSILAAIALTNTMTFWPGFTIMAIAIIASGVLMIVMADTVTEFIKKNRMYEVLGLFVLFIVGIMLLGEGGHLAHLKFFGYAVEPMAKTTFYFTLFVLLVVDIVQGRYRKKLLAQKEREVLTSGPGVGPEAG
ncbi:MAG: tellurium resistance protein TerC [Pseudomonadota bacterium]